MKKKLMIGICVAIVVFGAFNVYWYYAVHKLYDPFTENMDKLGHFTYCSDDSDGYGYTVGLPGYLHFNTGCLSVSSGENDMLFIIWPQYRGKEFKYGVIVPYENEMYEIQMTADQKPVNPNDQAIIDANAQEISMLYDRAEEKWGNLI